MSHRHHLIDIYSSAEHNELYLRTSCIGLDKFGQLYISLTNASVPFQDDEEKAPHHHHNLTLFFRIETILRDSQCFGFNLFPYDGTPRGARGFDITNSFRDGEEYFYYCNGFSSSSLSYSGCFVPNLNTSQLTSCERRVDGFFEVARKSSSWFLSTYDHILADFNPRTFSVNITFSPQAIAQNYSINSNLTIDFFFLYTSLSEVFHKNRNESYSKSEYKTQVKQLVEAKNFNSFRLDINTAMTKRWDDQCDEVYFQPRSFYYIWKVVSCFIVSVVCILLLIGLCIGRKTIYIQARFITPYISTVLFLCSNLATLIADLASFDSVDMDRMTSSVLIFIFSIYSFQTLRYFLCRLFYNSFYKDTGKATLWFKIVSSKITYVVVSIVIAIVETGVFYSITYMHNYIDENTLMDYLTFAAFGILILFSFTSILFFLYMNRKIIYKLRQVKKVVRWFFTYEDIFRYHGEFVTMLITAFFGIIYFVLSMINADYMTAYFLPNTNMMVSHVFGYALFGISKIFFEVSLACFEPGYLLFLYWRDSVTPIIEFEGLKEMKIEMEVFLATTFDGVDINIDLMKRFLTQEFRAELLQLYLFVHNNSDFTLDQISSKMDLQTIKDVLNVETTIRFRESLEQNVKILQSMGDSTAERIPLIDQIFSYQGNTDKWKKLLVGLIDVQMIDAYSRLKRTSIYRVEYSELRQKETDFVSKFLTVMESKK